MKLRSGSVVGGVPLNDLPEECWANVLSFTTARDVCRLSAVSPMFKLAAISNVVWERFLPSDVSISFPLPLMVLSRWNLFHPKGNCILAFVTIQFLLTMEEGAVNNGTRLSHWRDENEILFGTGKESFSLEKKSGKKRSMLSERDLVITWSHNPRYWKWNSNPASRFPEVAELITVCWLEIRGKINTSMLSPSILYTANLVFKFSIESYGFNDQPVEVAMKLDGDKICAHTVCWNEDRRGQQFLTARRPVDLFYISWRFYVPARESDGHYPKKRGDGWLEIELGDFFCLEGEDGELEMRVFDGTDYWKHGLIVEGIEIRPKEGN